MMAKLTFKGVELVPDAWDVFTREMRKIGKAPPIHKTAQSKI
jgi:hypothetical protein